MSQKKPPLTVVLESVFVRDHPRRLRLVVALLKEEARRPHKPPTPSQAQAETLRAFIATQNRPGGPS